MKSSLQFRTRILPALAAVVLLAGLIFLLMSDTTLSERHHPYSYTQPAFDFQTGSFADYISFSQQHLHEGRVDAQDEFVISMLSPFVLEPAASCPRSSSGKILNGVVLTHDLMDSPYTMRELGLHLQSRCFLVLGLLLPEHGTRPGDLLTSSWELWAAAEHFATRELANTAENVFLGGHGSGGTLAILEASGNAEVDGLLLFAPAMTSSAAPWYNWLTTHLAAVLPGLAWQRVLDDSAVYRYESLPVNLAREADALTQAMLDALPKRPFEIPVFTVASMEDNNVDTPAILAYAAQRSHEMSRTLLYSQHDLQPEALAAESGAPNPKLSVSSTSYPEQTVLSLSHTGLLLPLYDPQFGWDGAYRDCVHYHSADPKLYETCRNGGRQVYGEATAENLSKGVLERIGFNPFYQDLWKNIDAFFAPVIGSIEQNQAR